MITEGSLQDFSLPDLLQIIAQGNTTGTLTLHNEGRQGRYFFDGGKLLNARLGERQGRQAAIDLFLWTSGVFDFQDALPDGLVGEDLSLEEVTHAGLSQVERWRQILSELPDFFSARTWIFPMQLYQEQKPGLVETLGSGMSFADLDRAVNMGEMAVLEELLVLYRADQVGMSCSPEEQLRQLFSRMVNELCTQFASISGVKMVEGLEAQLNEQARKAHLGLRWRGGKVHDNLPDNWSKEQLLEAYRPLITTLQDFITKVYGVAFIERVVSPLLEEIPVPQRPLWAELTTIPASR